MKKHTEKQPIDDLFARKLGDMSITPGNRSWDELQHRMGNRQSVRIVPAWYRYAAAAACVLLVSGIGWKVYQTNDSNKPQEAVIANADKELEGKPGPTAETNEAGTMPLSDKKGSGERLANISKVASGLPVTKRETEKARKATIENKLPVNENNTQIIPAAQENNAVAAVVPQTEKLPSTVVEVPKITSQESIKTGTGEDASERKLVVMINTPVQVMPKKVEGVEIPEQSAASLQETADDEGLSKANRLFKKLKRIKNGEALAYKGETGDEEDAGLISRLYGNVRQSLETKKVSKR